MTVETCIPFNDFRIRLILADGTAYNPLAECIEAGNEAASSPGPYGPAREIRAFCWCAMHPTSGECVQQFLLAPDATEGAIRSRQRQPKCHRTGESRNDGGGNDGDDGGGGDPPPLTAAIARSAEALVEGDRP
jgi:hypothetical protein